MSAEEYLWQDDALCRQVDPELFFPDHSVSTFAAKRVCHNCPVMNECLEYALSIPGPVLGIWGGTNERDRREIRRNRLRSRRFTPAA